MGNNCLRNTVLYSIITHVRKVLCDFSGSSEQVIFFYAEINVKFAFDIRIFTLRIVSSEELCS